MSDLRVQRHAMNLKDESIDSPALRGLPEELLFASNFGGTTRLVPSVGPYFHGAPEQYEDFVGVDPSKPVPNDWGEIANHPKLGGLRIYHEGGTPAQRSATIEADEADPTRRLLRFRLAEPNVTIDWPDGPQHKSRVQAELYGNTGLTELYQKVRLRFHPDVEILEQYPQRFTWLTLFEFWNQPFWDHPFPFRISIAAEKPTAEIGEGLYFCAEAQRLLTARTFKTLWKAHPRGLRIPYGQWMEIEIYYREGDAATGRLFMAVKPEGQPRQVLLDVRDVTHHPDNPAPAGLTHYNPMKVYTSAELIEFMRDRGRVMQLDWTDFELWTGRLPDGCDR